MVDNRYATALVIGSVLSLLATVYLSVAVGTQHWYQYRSPPGNHEASNASELREDFINGEFDEKAYSDTLFRLNGTLGLWWRCVQAPGQSHWFKEPDPKMVTQCVSFTLPQQFLPKYKEPGNHNTGEDLLRTFGFSRCLSTPVEVPVPVASGVPSLCVPQRTRRRLRLPLPQHHPHPGRWSAPPAGRSVFPRHGVLLPGWHGPAPQGLCASRRCGRLPGLVPVPGPHLLATADDGGRPLPVGRPEPPPELHPHDGLPGGLKRLGFLLYDRVAFSKSITF
ncbi:uncharacterized protein ACWYII_031589 isoform 1-T5 [Salvelinus alpinus]